MRFSSIIPGMGILLSAAFYVPAEPVEVLPPAVRGAIQPQIAVAADGGVFVAFGKGTNIYCAASTGDRLEFQAPVLIAGLPKLALGMRRGPRVVAFGKHVVVSAISHADGNLYRWFSSDRGVTWSPPLRINSVTKSALEGLHAMAGREGSALHVVWLDLRNGGAELWHASSSDGGQSWSENTRVYRSPDGHICECCHPSLAVDGSGNIWAAWRNWIDGARDIYAGVSRDGGKTFSDVRKLGTGTWTLKACPMDGGHLAFNREGALLAVWRRGESVFASSGASEMMLSPRGRQPVIFSTEAGSTFLWQQGSTLMMKHGDGAPAVLASPGAFATVAASSPGGRAVVAWESVTNNVKTILAQRLD